MGCSITPQLLLKKILHFFAPSIRISRKSIEFGDEKVNENKKKFLNIL